MKPHLDSAEALGSHESVGVPSSGGMSLASRPFLIGLAFTVLSIAIAWVAAYQAFDGGPTPVGASMPSAESAADLSRSERVALAGGSVSEGIDLLYAELPLQMSDQEWRRDVSSASTRLEAGAEELATLLADESGTAEVQSILLEMCEAADDLRSAVQAQSPEAARSALERMDSCVQAWEAHGPGDGAE
jgi:hypothetical protein